MSIFQPDVLIVFPGIEIGTGGGAEKQTLRLAHGLVASGYRVTIVASRPGWRLPLGGAIKLNDYQIPVLYLPCPSVWLLGSILYALLVSIYLLTGLFRTTVVHIVSINRISALIAVIARVSRKRVICRSIGGDVWLLSKLKCERHPVARIHILALQLIDAVVAQSQEQASMLGNLGIEKAKITEIPNGVDVSYYRPYQGNIGTLRSRLALPENSKVICWVGVLRSIKRVDLILEAFNLLTAKYPDCQLLLVGDGEQWDALHELADSLGIDGKVRFEGQVDDPLPYLQSADVFVFPSDMETHPNALIEAMSCGLPIVATAVSGNNECIQHRVNGILVPRGAADELARAILEICEDKTLATCLGTHARQSVLECYTIEQMVDKYLHLYRLG